VQRQEDLSEDVRIVAFCKFAFIIFATAHWIGCIYFYLASYASFTEDTLNMNWISAWVEQSLVDYTWYKDGGAYMYTVILFKGFALLTNMGYEDAVHTRALLCRFCANLQLLPWIKEFEFLLCMSQEVEHQYAVRFPNLFLRDILCHADFCCVVLPFAFPCFSLAVWHCSGHKHAI
jgi:hypothetical protein